MFTIVLFFSIPKYELSTLDIGFDKRGLNFALDENDNLKKCRQRCEMQEDYLSSSSATYPNKHLFPRHTEEFCLILKKVTKVCNDETKSKVFDERYGKDMNCTHLLQSSESLLQYCENDPLEVFGEEAWDLEDTIEHIFMEKYEPIKELLYKYAKENIAIVYIFIRDPYYTKIKKDEAISIVSFISNTGGLVGLCLGLSLVSVFEIIYHCFNFIRIQK